jgi:aminodeoxyfutalosine synthase
MPMTPVQRDRLREIRKKVESGERLSMDDGLFLEEPSTPLQEIGVLANWVREKKHGNVAYYNINTHLNPTNVCVYRCRFCAFRSDLRDPKGYVMNRSSLAVRRRPIMVAPRCMWSAVCTIKKITTGIAACWRS